MRNKIDIGGVPLPVEVWWDWYLGSYFANTVTLIIRSTDGWEPVPAGQAAEWLPGNWFLEDGRESIGVAIQDGPYLTAKIDFPEGPDVYGMTCWYGWWSNPCPGLQGQRILPSGAKLLYSPL